MGKKNNRWIDEKNRWMVGWTGKTTMVGCIEKIDGQLGGYTLINEIIYGWLDGYKNNTNQMNGWIEEKMMVGGQKKMDGWMDG